MSMSEITREAKRGGARVFGIVFQFLAVIALFATVVVAFKVANLGTQIGIDGTKDPLVWIVLVSGAFVTCVLAGFGYTLGILCAIYDRQEPDDSGPDLDARPTYALPKPPSKPPEAGPWAVPSAPPKPKIQTPPPPKTRTPDPQPEATKESSALWQQLTRERHLFRKREG
jgi:hypothetical protein